MAGHLIVTLGEETAGSLLMSLRQSSLSQESSTWKMVL